MAYGAYNEKRVALVIGNAAYVHAGELTNPTNDAKDISQALKGLGFSIATGLDLARDPMENAFFNFATAIQDADVALLFYAGHGLQVKGENYLIPVDANIEMEMHLRRALSLSEVLGGMSESTAIKLIFLDACRDNPFTRAMRREGARGLQRGLAAVHAEGDTFIAFATAPNQVAHDGLGRNSPYTTALLEHIGTPNIIIQEMMIDVTRDVSIATSNCQRPWYHTDFRVRYYFKPPELDTNSTTDVIAKKAEKQRPAKKNATPGAIKVAAIISALGSLTYVAAGSLSYIAFGALGAVALGFLILLAIYLPQTYKISDYLTLAERELNSWLRAWGGGLSTDARKALAEERIKLLQMHGAQTADAKRGAVDMNLSDLVTDGPPGFAMGRARFTAFLLREIYEGNVKNAQIKIFSAIKSGNKPYIAPGIRQIVGYDQFNEHDVENHGFPPDAGIDWFPLWLTVKLNRFPRNIVMVRTDKSRAYNRDVIDELTTQLMPKASSGVEGIAV